jgi:ATP-binding cassette subfamily F protein uup
MARSLLLQLSDISLTFGGAPLFDALDVSIHDRDRLALVGRNGSGKSTLMKIMAGLVEADQGQAILSPGCHAGYLEQDPNMEQFSTLGDFSEAKLGAGEVYRAERAAAGLKLDLTRPVATASGGERRRAALATMLGGSPELMLLDEPTNHLDIDAIRWLEGELSRTASGFVLISHDRAFLKALTRGTLWLDRGVVRRQDKGFAAFEDWRDKVWQEEDDARHKLNRKIKAEARWAVEGISARRKRNQGRLRALQALRADRAAQIQRTGTAAMELASGPKSGRKVIEAKGLGKRFGEAQIVRDFSLTVTRGECIAFVGPNGVGKTTLLKLLLGEVTPDHGSVKHGTGLEVAVFDQTRAQLDPEATLWDSLTQDPAMRVSGQSDQVMVRGTPKHVVGYLKDFLFDERQARAKVRSLSGGEKVRLLLARLMAQPCNLLVLDEPTNDLDIETLDLLQDLLGGFDGTVLLVSHDRDFIDRVATTTIVFEGQGRTVVYAGGWSDAVGQMTPQSEALTEPAGKKKAFKSETKKEKRPVLSFTEKHRLENLPDEIAQIEAEIGKLEGLMADPDLFTKEPVKFAKAAEMLTERQAKLAAAEEEWLDLAERAEAG